MQTTRHGGRGCFLKRGYIRKTRERYKSTTVSIDKHEFAIALGPLRTKCLLLNRESSERNGLFENGPRETDRRRQYVRRRRRQQTGYKTVALMLGHVGGFCPSRNTRRSLSTQYDDIDIRTRVFGIGVLPAL